MNGRKTKVSFLDSFFEDCIPITIRPAVLSVRNHFNDPLAFLKGRKMKMRTISIMPVLIFLLCAYRALATTYYVNPGGSIQAAIDGAGNGDEIEVAPGTYNEAINFLTKAVRVYSTGGPTVTTINGSGHYHVIQCVLGEGADSILEGFKITGGKANGTGANSEGGGMRIANSSPTILNCNFASNTAVNGGGIFMTSANPTVTHCTFTANSATSGGGGIHTTNGSSPFVTDCTFTGNSATNSGGGVYNYYTSMTFTRCTFTGNTTPGDGAGIYNTGGSSTITDCSFSSNNANYGGGIYNTFSASPWVTHCVFVNNTALGSMGWAGGGGVLNQAGAAPVLINCLFKSNNECAMANLGYGEASHATAVNCIFWGDIPSEIYNSSGSATITYSDVQGGYTGTGNINADPLFLNAAGGDFRFISSGSPCVDTGDNSVVAEPNDLSGNPRIVDGDWNGTATVDMGVYELQSRQIHNITQDTWYELIQTAVNDAVNADQIEVGPGTYNEAVNFSGKAIELYSSSGSEATTIDATGLNASVVTCKSGEGYDTALEGFTLTGGVGTVSASYRFGGGMYNLNSSPTVTDCIFTANAVSGDGGGMYNTNSSPMVSGCQFEENSANYAGGGMDNRSGSHPTVSDCDFSQNTAGTNGGGMENNNNAHATVINCTFTNNKTTTNDGGGMYNYNSNATVIHCTFSGNICNTNGGGMKNAGLTPAINDCAFIDNVAGGNGGGMHNDNSNPILTNCQFSGNTATYGGGLHNHNSKPTVSNGIFQFNMAATFGGGIANYNSSHCFITNCTILGNTAGGGAGIRNYSSSPTVTNCIVWGNEPDSISTEVSGPIFTYNDIQGGYDGPGNIDVDPNFVDADNPDLDLINLRLLAISPCIDAGNTTAVTQSVLVDLDGTPRALDDPSTPDTGVSFLNVTVDMGAYEYDPCLIEGDINCDGRVDLIDAALLSANWLRGVGG